jgi:hypothetical protein
MTSFTVAGRFHGRTVEITWIGGKLSGDPEVVQLTERQAAAGDSQPTMAGDDSDSVSASTDHLSDPYVAYELIRMQLQEPEIVSGQLPPVAPAPHEQE